MNDMLRDCSRSGVGKLTLFSGHSSEPESRIFPVTFCVQTCQYRNYCEGHRSLLPWHRVHQKGDDLGVRLGRSHVELAERFLRN